MYGLHQANARGTARACGRDRAGFYCFLGVVDSQVDQELEKEVH